jgi:hypothetical protein
VHPADQLFGANFDAYKCAWTGCSIAVPDFDQHAAARATKWAIRSALSTDIPTVTILLVPTYCADNEDAAHMRLVNLHRQCCRMLFKAPGKLVDLQPPGNAPLMGTKTMHWRLHAIAIGNAAGFEQHLPLSDHEWHTRFREAITNALPHKTTDRSTLKVNFDTEYAILGFGGCSAASIMTEARWVANTSKRFQRKPQDSRKPARLSGLSSADLGAHELQVLNAQHSVRLSQADTPPALMHRWEAFTYTDGGVI